MTRDEMIKMMKECMEDAEKIVFPADHIVPSCVNLRDRMAVAFFQYRCKHEDADEEYRRTPGV